MGAQVVVQERDGKRQLDEFSAFGGRKGCNGSGRNIAAVGLNHGVCYLLDNFKGGEETRHGGGMRHFGYRKARETTTLNPIDGSILYDSQSKGGGRR